MYPKLVLLRILCRTQFFEIRETRCRICNFAHHDGNFQRDRLKQKTYQFDYIIDSVLLRVLPTVPLAVALGCMRTFCFVDMISLWAIDFEGSQTITEKTRLFGQALRFE